MKRAVGLFVMLLMLHLSWVRSDLSCATHVHHAAAGAHDMGGMAASNVVHPSQRHTEDGRPCNTPATADCCAALSSCGPVFDASETGTPSLLVAAPADLVQRYSGAALSRAIAPETPPPRA